MTKNSNAFMPLYVGDYLADTTMLTRDQHGAYLLLIMTYWRNRGPLPDRDDGLAMASRSTPQEWKRLRPILEAFFVVKDGVWTHKRIDEELVKADEKYAARVNASRKANGVRHGHRNGDQSDTVTVPNHNHTPTKKSHTGSSSDRRAKGSVRSPNGATPPSPGKDWADEIPAWKAFKDSLHPTEWAVWFSKGHPNGSTESYVAESTFQRDEVAARYLPRLLSHFGEDFKLKLKKETEQ